MPFHFFFVLKNEDKASNFHTSKERIIFYVIDNKTNELWEGYILSKWLATFKAFAFPKRWHKSATYGLAKDLV